jgi:YegS/Rv2252/BmrU family lipid kinase
MGILFIVNPVAGKGKALRTVPQVEKICKQYNCSYEVKYTEGPRDAERIAREAEKEGYKKIVVVAGDGTLNEVINGIEGLNTAIGIIPGGSGNDFIRTINPHTDIEEIIYDNLFGDIIEVDVAACNDRKYINIASVGLDAEIVEGTIAMKKYFSGSKAYLASILRTVFTYKGQKMNITIDGMEIEKEVLLSAIANGKYYGGGIMPAPDADIQDKLLDICIVNKFPLLKEFYLLPKYMKGKHKNLKGVSFNRGKRIEVTSPRQMAVNFDGELFRDDRVVFRILDQPIKIIVPKKKGE